MSDLLHLDVPRTIVLTDRGRVFRLHCRRVTAEDWMAYFAGIVITSEQNGRSVENVFDASTPRLALAESVLTGAEGYTIAGGGELTDIPGWQKKIPLAHRMRLGEVLGDARATSPDEFVIQPECELVSLSATWGLSGDQDETGTYTAFMERFDDLKHFLATPTEEQHRRYTREASRSRVVGGSRTGKTIYHGAKPLLAKLYDELVVSVDGYAVHGMPLGSDTYAIRREMDTLHKVMAAQELFQPASTVTLASAADPDAQEEESGG